MSFRKIRPLGRERHYALWQGPSSELYLSDASHPTGGAQGPLRIDTQRSAVIGPQWCAVPVIIEKGNIRGPSINLSHQAFRDLLGVLPIKTVIAEEALEVITTVQLAQSVAKPAATN